MATEKNPQLTEIQLAVMRALWDAGQATTAAVHQRMGKPRSLAYTTVATLLNRLEKRGLVTSRKGTRERVFEPLVTEADVKHHMVSDLVAKLFRGDPSALVSHLVSDAELDEADLETVRRMLAEARSKAGGDVPTRRAPDAEGSKSARKNDKRRHQ